MRQIATTDGAVIAGGTEQPGHDAIGKTIAQITGIDSGINGGIDDVDTLVGDNPADLFAAADAVLDFTAPAATAEHARLAAASKGAGPAAAKIGSGRVVSGKPGFAARNE